MKKLKLPYFRSIFKYFLYNFLLLLILLLIILLSPRVESTITSWHLKAKRILINSKYTKIEGNDFNLIISLIPTKNPPHKTAGILDINGILVPFDQSSDEAWKQYQKNNLLTDTNLTFDFNGGIKQIFNYKNELIALLTLKRGACYYASIVNLTKSKKIYDADCLPLEGLDFNGIGGGVITQENGFLFALGTPTTDYLQIGRLAQDLSSPYGKVLFFNEETISNSSKKINKFTIYSTGHRNPQGMIKIKNNIYLIEQGPKGGDEINLLEKDGNYGWPIYSMGSKYNGTPISSSDLAPEKHNSLIENNMFKNPLYAFIPSVALSDITYCPQNILDRYFPFDCLLISSLRGQSIYIVLVSSENKRVISIQKYFVGMRVREFNVMKEKNRTLFSTDDYGVYSYEFENIYK